MKDKELCERRMWGAPPEKIYEVYDAVDTNHKILICSECVKSKAVEKAREYAKKHGIPLKCLECYELIRQD